MSGIFRRHDDDRPNQIPVASGPLEEMDTWESDLEKSNELTNLLKRTVHPRQQYEADQLRKAIRQCIGENRVTPEVILAMGEKLASAYDTTDHRRAVIIRQQAHKQAKELAERQGKSAAPEKLSQIEAEYTPWASDPAESCERCAHFIQIDRCERVEGRIASGGTCKLFSREQPWSEGNADDVPTNSEDLEI